MRAALRCSVALVLACCRSGAAVRLDDDGLEAPCSEAVPPKAPDHDAAPRHVAGPQEDAPASDQDVVAGPATSSRAASKPSEEDLPADDIAEWLDATNRYRCWHGVPPVSWNYELARSAQAWAAKFPPMRHSHSFELTPPSAENLASSADKDIEGVVDSWYNENSDCTAFPGCTPCRVPGKSVGQFTAMVWKGVRQIGCGVAKSQKPDDQKWYYVCRYAAGNSLSYDSPNMQGAYAQNIFKAQYNDHDCGKFTTTTPCGTGTTPCSEDASPAVENTTHGDMFDWLTQTNLYRCMHGAKALAWNAQIAREAEEWIDQFPPMKHSESYKLSPPMAENLASSPEKDISGRLKAWYEEVHNCEHLPGCERSKTSGKHTGHFTAMVWHAATEMGCAATQKLTSTGVHGIWYYICRYASGPNLTNATVNMLGSYDANVKVAARTQEECIKLLHSDGEVGDPSTPPDAPTQAGEAKPPATTAMTTTIPPIPATTTIPPIPTTTTIPPIPTTTTTTTTTPAEPDEQQWLKTINEFRCMHGVPPVKWNEKMAGESLEWVKKFPPLKHSDSYNLKPPCAENLAHTTMVKDIRGRVADWYEESKHCDKFPGCEKSSKAGKTVGHFTAMVWKGVKEIGCAAHESQKDQWFYLCRFASGPGLSYDTANMEGGYTKNILAASVSAEKCKQEIDGKAQAAAK
eukprot:TRINITY_DN76897_c0_g1_i1.p1 TRINITY_DN76897_c0_g1~~TRINITY_DN76897_c0_g1_i1.p1  ORF type:complete len:687 (-),score=146.05 TRINITY_DN76897_c0_g1_i1:25-2085(-)